MSAPPNSDSDVNVQGAHKTERPSLPGNEKANRPPPTPWDSVCAPVRTYPTFAGIAAAERAHGGVGGWHEVDPRPASVSQARCALVAACA